MQPTSEQLAELQAFTYQRAVMLRFADDVDVPFDEGGPAVAVASHAPPMVAPGSGALHHTWVRDVTSGRADVRVRRLFQSVTLRELRELRQRATAAAGGAVVPKLENMFLVVVPDENAAADVMRSAEALPGIEDIQLQAPPHHPPVQPADDPRSSGQGYLAPAPVGIDARFAWTQPGGDGAGVTFVDLEQGWNLTHEDLVGGSVSLISGLNHAFHGHGTAVLGEVVGQDNTVGVVGIAPQATAKVVSQWRTAVDYNTAEAIVSAILHMPRGGVLLLEAQTSFGARHRAAFRHHDGGAALL